jgi:hypothetical protein
MKTRTCLDCPKSLAGQHGNVKYCRPCLARRVQAYHQAYQRDTIVRREPTAIGEYRRVPGDLPAAEIERRLALADEARRRRFLRRSA